MRKYRAKIRLVLFIAVLLFNGWMWYSFQSANLPNGTFDDTEDTRVTETDDFIIYEPAYSQKQVLIFYPGGLVDPYAYAPLCRNLSKYNYKTIIVKMPWRMANLGYTIPLEKGILKDSSKQFVFIGHSKGAAMVAQLAKEYPEHVFKAVLLATTHPTESNLSHLNIPIMKIYGSKDGIAGEEKIVANKQLLPPSTKYVRIDGGNHAQFAYYGRQFWDGVPTITREQQQEIVLKNILSFLK